MLRITKQADYGIVLLSHLAHQPERLFSATELAAETNLPQPIVGKILKLLARDGVLESQRGAKGGYALSRPSDEISVAEIVEALEGPIAVTECIDEAPGECQQEARCPMRGPWQRINSAIREALEGISLRQMAEPLPDGVALVQLGGHRTSGTSAEL